jgi:hypothetical protein
MANACRRFNATRIILVFRNFVISVCHKITYDVGRLQGCARFWAEFNVKIAQSRCALMARVDMSSICLVGNITNLILLHAGKIFSVFAHNPNGF